jgi:hypothetical protein
VTPFLWLDDDPDGLAQPGDLLGLLQRHGIDHGLIEDEGVVLGRNVLGHQDKAPETLSLGLVAVLALVAGGVDLDRVHLLLLLLLIRRPFSESDMIEEKSDKVCEWLRAIGSDAIGSHPPPGRDRAEGEVEIMLAARPQKITFGDMRQMGVRGVLIYCAD